MSPTNGHADDPANGSVKAVQQFALAASDTNIPTALTPTAAKIKELIANLEVPFHPSVVEWRVTNTSKGGSPRGQVMPYADQRAYTDRLNTLVTPAGWTRRYAVHTSANFERSKDQKIVAKVLVTCELTIFGLGCLLEPAIPSPDRPASQAIASCRRRLRAALLRFPL
jgi:Rad52/22 family double-strand break repair protein